MTKRKIWIILFIIGIVMILGASEFSRFLANEINWYTAGIILSIVSGLGLLFEMYFRRKAGRHFSAHHRSRPAALRHGLRPVPGLPGKN